MVAALTYDPQVADDLSPLFESVLIPQIATPTGLVPMVPSRQRRSPGSTEEIPVNMEIKVVADVLQRCACISVCMTSQCINWTSKFKYDFGEGNFCFPR